MVFDGVVGAAGEEAGDGGPLVAVEGVGFDDEGVLGGGERAVVDAGAQLVAPPQAARLAGPPWYPGAYQGPVARTMLVDELYEGGILLWAPRAFYTGGSNVV